MSAFKNGELARNTGFTTTELMVSMAVFSLVLTGIIFSHMFGMKMFNLTATKLNASQGARAAVNRVREEVRASKVLLVGKGTATNFNTIPDNSPHQGNALQISTTSDTNRFVCYYLDPEDQKLKRRFNGSSIIEVLADSITNGVVFRAEDYQGNIRTNDDNIRVVRMVLEFRQWDFMSERPPDAATSDYYRFETRIARRVLQ